MELVIFILVETVKMYNWSRRPLRLWAKMNFEVFCYLMNLLITQSLRKELKSAKSLLLDNWGR
jgi:hypothetical protein